MDKLDLLRYDLHPMKPPLWILVTAMISSLVASGQEGSKVLLDDRFKLQRSPKMLNFGIEIQNFWVTNPSEPRMFAAAYFPQEAVIQTQTAAKAGDSSSQARLATFYLNGIAPSPKTPSWLTAGP